MTEKTKDLQSYEVNNGSLVIYGLDTPGDFSTRYVVGSGLVENRAITYYYPENAFASYNSTVSFLGIDGTFRIKNSTNGLPDFEPLAANERRS